MERRKGFLQINDYQLIRNCQKETDGKYCVAWIRIDETEYLYKEYQNKNTCYKEVFWSYVLNGLGIQNVGYDLASNEGRFGVITKNAKKEGQRTKSISELITDFKKANIEYRYSSLFDLFNVKDLEKVLAFHYKQQMKEEELKRLNESLLKQFIIQLLSGNCDLHDRNINIVEGYLIDFFPYFDFGGYNLTNFKITNYNHFCLPFIKVIYMESPRQTVQNFLNNGTKNEIEILKLYIEKFRTFNTSKIFQQMEDDISFKLPRNIKKDLSKKLVQNSDYIDRKIRNVS